MDAGLTGLKACRFFRVRRYRRPKNARVLWVAVVWAVLTLGLTVPTVSALEVTPRGSARSMAAVNLEGPAIHALSGFLLLFNGDHKVRTIGVALQPGRARGWLADQNGDDLMSFSVSYESGLRGRLMPRVHRVGCRRFCDLRIERPVPGETFVLTGFHFNKQRGDTNLLRLAVDPSPSAGNVRVSFEDNGSNFPFDVWLTYAYARVDGITERRLDTQSRASKRATVPLSDSRSRLNLLQGFSLEYLNGDHYVGQVSVQPKRDGGYAVQLRDRNYDDPIKAWVRYGAIPQAPARRSHRIYRRRLND